MQLLTSGWLNRFLVFFCSALVLCEAQSQWRTQFAMNHGEFYIAPDGPHQLHRLIGEFYIRLMNPEHKDAVLASLLEPGRSFEGYSVERVPGSSDFYLQASVHERWLQMNNPPRYIFALEELRSTPGIRLANPVYVSLTTGFRQVVREELIICLQEGFDPGLYFGMELVNTRQMVGPDQYLVTVRGAEAEDILLEVNARSLDPRVKWVQPNFQNEGKSTAINDPLLGSQWGLGRIRALTAWDRNSGESAIIAVLDSGVELDHPDLTSSFVQNDDPNFPNQITDDNDNGWLNDNHGWDFRGNNGIDGPEDAIPDPVTSFDNHGTAVAGVIAATGNNSIGIAGSAYSSKLLVVRYADSMAEDGLSFMTQEVTDAIYYAAGRKKPPLSGTWRGADIINISASWSFDPAISTALAWAAVNGRNGLGCVLVCSSGNNGGAWEYFSYEITTAGTYTFKWEYIKDASSSAGDDAVWIDEVTFPPSTIERFEGTSLPSEWTSSGAASWVSVEDWVVNGLGFADHAYSGTGKRAVRSGPVSHSQSSVLQTSRAVQPGWFSFWYWVSSESNDKLRFSIPELSYSTDVASGVAPVTTEVGYPASHANAIAVGACSDSDFRSDYSQFTTSLKQIDFLGPSSGGGRSILTTDRTGADGYHTSGDTAWFGGTSAAAPFAAGVAAMVLSKHPEFTAEQVRTRLRSTSKKIGQVTYDASGWNRFYGFGKIDAHAAIVQGQVNSAFNGRLAPSGPNSGVESILTVTVGRSTKPIIAGSFSSVDGIARHGIARLDVSGDLDSSFVPPTSNGSIYAVAEQTDGKLVIGGSFTTLNGYGYPYLGRLNANGSHDSAFYVSGLNYHVTALVLQGDGKILIGGSFTGFGYYYNRLARLNANGTTDTSFATGGPNGNVECIVIQADGKILVGGAFTGYSGRNYLVRLNSEGGVDSTFNPGSNLNNSVFAIAVQPDGKILIGGYFTAYGGTSRNRLARLNSDGTLDTTFDPGTGASGGVHALRIVEDGDILIGGNFLTCAGITRNRIARLKVNGALDDLFDPGAGLNGSVDCIHFPFSGGYYVGGGFSSVNNISHEKITLLHGK